MTKTSEAGLNPPFLFLFIYVNINDEIRRVLREMRGGEPSTITVYHGTHTSKAPKISSEGLKASDSMGYDNAGWYVVATDFNSALFHATPEDQSEAVVFEFEVPLTNGKWEGYPYFWPPHERGVNSKWFALKQPLTPDMIKKVHRVSHDDYLDQKNKGLNEEVIEETQEGQKDLEEFTNDILMLMGEVSVKTFEDNKIYYGEDNSRLLHFPMVVTGKMDGDKYNEIGDFVKETSIRIVPTTFIDKEGTQGRLEYASPHDNMGREMFSIKLKYTQEQLKEVNDLLVEKPYGDVKPKDVYFKLFYVFYTTLLHELQHAYDAWRSKGKAFGGQRSKEYVKKQQMADKLEKKPTSDLTPEERNALSDSYNAYLNLTHEINARYAQAMQKARLTSVDDEWNEIMKPWKEAYSSFRSNFKGWRILSDKMKKRLINRLAKAYQYESEHLQTAEEKYGKEEAEEIKRAMAENVRYIVRESIREAMDSDARSFDLMYFKDRIPFLKDYEVNYSPDDNPHQTIPERIELNKIAEAKNVTLPAGGDIYTFPKVTAISEFTFYPRKIHDNTFYVIAIKNKIVPWQPEGMSDITYRVLMAAAKMQNERMSGVHEIVVPEGEAIPNSELNATINGVNKSLFEFDEKASGWQVDFF